MTFSRVPLLVLCTTLAVPAGCDDPSERAPTDPSRERSDEQPVGAAEPGAAEPGGSAARYAAPVERIVERSGESEFATDWLHTLCVDIGHRLSGSESLERAVRWAAGELEDIEGVEVTLQEVQVPVWIRGQESLQLLGQEPTDLAMVGLGGSVGTPEEGVEGALVIVSSLEDLDARGEELRGKIVLIDQAMPPYDPETFDTGYGSTVSIRTRGPARAAAHGALAVLVRSVTDDANSPPHTGATHYPEDGPRIPGAAVSVAVVTQLRALAEDGTTPRLRLRMQAHTEEDATSHNVIAELRGTDLPDEIVVFGGHIDSWDVGQGCHDDAAGVVSAMAALRLLVELDLRPRRTVRAVLWTNEENGLRGGRAYSEIHFGDGLHVAGIESDIGAARVIGLNVETEEVREPIAIAQLQSIADLLAPTGVRVARAGHAGSDISPLRERGVPTVGILHDPAHYFDLHHTAADTFESVDQGEFLQGVGVMATTAYILADMPARLSNPR